MPIEYELTDENQTPSATYDENNKPSVSFAELLQDYAPEPLKQGQYLQGKIVQISPKIILIDVDAKRTAVVPPQDIERIKAEELAHLSVGDVVPLCVLRAPEGNEDLLVSLNKGLEQKDWTAAQTYLDNDELLELEIVGHNKGGLMVAFEHLRGFVPVSHVPQLQHTHNPNQLASQKAKLVGQKLPLKMIEVDRKRRRLVLSAKKAQRELRQQRLLELKLKEGETINGRITNLVKFGAFVDLDGVEGLIHISQIAWQKIDRASDILSPGEEIEVLIKSVDIEKERVSLSRKALLPSPWELFDQTHGVGDLVEGVVTNATNFGAFVLITDGIEGLVHISELRGAQGFMPQDILSPGDTILTRILIIQPQRQRLALSQKRISQNEEMEWIWRRQQLPAAVASDEEE